VSDRPTDVIARYRPVGDALLAQFFYASGEPRPKGRQTRVSRNCEVTWRPCDPDTEETST